MALLVPIAGREPARRGVIMKIALIAMSGVRAHNPELTALGLTLPGFVERGKAIASLPSLSLLTLAALTPDPHEVAYIEVDDIDDVTLPNCDLAAISTYTAQAFEAYGLADRLEAAGIPTVMGGLHATVVPFEALEHCSAVVVGEGEVVWPEVLADAVAGKMSGIYDARDRPYDLASSPIPRYELLDPDRYNRLTVQTSRGCPWHCEFCAGSILLTDRYRTKPPKHVAAEIEAIKTVFRHPFVEFADDNTFVGKAHGRALMDAIGNAGVHWFTETDISVADDDALLRMMKAAGCAEVLVGLESPSAAGLDHIELKHNWKRHQLDHHAAAVETIQAHGIAVNACFVLGLDGDGPEIFDAVEEFVERALPFDVQITVMTAFPGTPLYERLLAEGRILRPGAWDRCTLFDVNIRPERMTVEELEHGLVGLGRRLYSEDATRRRRSGFKETWRAGRRKLRVEPR
jgi:radical SAM superfamily enzyme YgiQ (UPF0313 family)